MKNKILILASILLSLFCHPGEIWTQQENRGMSVRFDGSGILVEFETNTDPPQSDNQFELRGNSYIRAEKNITHRVFVDRTSGAIFGYDLEVDPVLVRKQFKLSIKPLSIKEIDLKSLLLKNAPAKVNIPLIVSKSQKYPSALLVDDGGTIALDVLINPETGVKIVDSIRVSSQAKQAHEKAAQPLRDFSADAIVLSVKEFRLRINGKVVLGAENPINSGVSGAMIWLYIPGRGRFIFSLIPREGFDFQKTGKIQGNKISFQIGSDRYEWISSAPIFGSAGDDNWNLWVLQDRNYSADDEIFSLNGYQIGAFNRIENILKKK